MVPVRPRWHTKAWMECGWPWLSCSWRRHIDMFWWHSCFSASTPHQNETVFTMTDEYCGAFKNFLISCFQWMVHNISFASFYFNQSLYRKMGGFHKAAADLLTKCNERNLLRWLWPQQNQTTDWYQIVTARNGSSLWESTRYSTTFLNPLTAEQHLPIMTHNL